MAKRSSPSRVLITGASSGIGRALAIELARGKSQMVLVARRREALDRVVEDVVSAGGDAVSVPGDVTSKDIRVAALEAAEQRFGGLDVLVNNAGISAWGRFAEAGEDRLRRIMEVNFFALAEMTRQALPLVSRGERPLVINISSILGHRGIPYQVEYCASKFAVRGFSEALRPELKRLGIDLLVVSPGTTDSEFFEHLLENSGEMPWGRQPGVSPDYVAKRVVRAIGMRKHEIIPSTRGTLLVWLNRLCPRLVDAWLSRYG